MLLSRYIVVSDFPDGSSDCLYNGSDSVAASKAMAGAVEKGEAQAVLIFAHPTHSQVRYPLQEKLDAKERVARAEEVKTAGVSTKKTEAAAHREKAKQLTADAKRLEAEAAAELKELEKTDE
jgi:hypothetical protein